MAGDSRGSLASASGDYNSDNDLEEALMSGTHYRQITNRRTRGRLLRSHSVCDTSISHQPPLFDDPEERGPSRSDAVPGPGKEGGPGEGRLRRPMSARGLRLSSSFDDGCSGRERVSARINSADTNLTLRTSNTSSENVTGTQNIEKQSKTSSSARNLSQKPPHKSSSIAKIGVNRSASNFTSSFRDQTKSKGSNVEMKGHRESSKKTANTSNQKDANSLKQQPRATLQPVRRTSLDIKVHNGDKATTDRQPTPHGPRSNAKAGVYLSGTMSAHCSPHLTRSSQLLSSGNHKARYHQCLSLSCCTHKGPEVIKARCRTKQISNG